MIKNLYWDNKRELASSFAALKSFYWLNAYEENLIFGRRRWSITHSVGFPQVNHGPPAETYGFRRSRYSSPAAAPVRTYRPKTQLKNQFYTNKNEI
jgi:hypothetical protein